MKKYLIVLLLAFGIVSPTWAYDVESIRFLLKNAQKQATVDVNLALTYANDALAQAKSMPDELLMYDAYRKLGSIMEDNNRLEEAKNYYAQALAMYENKAIPQGHRLDILNEWAIIHKKMGKYKIAQDYHFLTIELAKKIGDQEMIEFGYHGLGTMYSMMSDFNKAIEYYYLSIQAAEASGNKSGAVVTQQNISNIYIKAQNAEMAQKSIEKALQMATALNDTARIACVLHIYARAEIAANRYDEALKKDQTALAIFEKNGNKRELGETMLSIADNYLEQKKYEQSEDFFYQCKPLLPYLLPYGNACFYTKLGKLYTTKGENQEAIKSLQKALVLSDSLGFKELRIENHKLLATLFEQRKDYKQAFFHASEAEKYCAELFKDDRQKNLIEAQFKFDVAEGEKQILQLKEQKSKNIAYFGIGLIALMGLFSIYNIRKNKRLREKNQAIEIQNQKLEAHNDSLVQVAYAAAHDLKEPLRNIGSFVNLIQKKFGTQLPQGSEEYMGFVTGNTARLNELFTGLLEYATLVANNDEFHDTSDLNLVVNDVLKNCEDEIALKNAKITVSNDLPLVAMKHQHAVKILENILQNALKFSEKTPEIYIDAKQINPNEVQISIKDNGIGILKMQNEKIFNLFYRGDRSENNEGTGLGLALCKAIIDKYNGKITFKSDGENGSTFFVKIANILETG